MAEEALQDFSRKSAQTSSVKFENLQSALVRSMLRFRNLTGSYFDSAAQAKYQNHDSMLKDDHKTG